MRSDVNTLGIPWKLTKSGTNGAIKAPSRATVLAAPTPIERITVGNISAVWTYEVENADVIPSFPNKNNETTAQVFSIFERKKISQVIRT